MGESKKATVALVIVDFHGDEIQTWCEGEKVYACLKGICETLGVDWSGQRTKIVHSPLYSKHIRYGDISTPGGKQETLGLDLEYFPMWLASISLERVKSSIRDKLLLYQEQCAKALRDYWFKGMAIAPSPSGDLARFDLMQMLLDEQRRAAEERALLAARQDTLETDVAAMKAERPPEGKYTVEDWLKRYSKPYLPKPMLKNLKAFCRSMEDAERVRPGWSNYPLLYYKPETIERAYALVTKQISFIEEAGVSYGNGNGRKRKR